MGGAPGQGTREPATGPAPGGEHRTGDGNRTAGHGNRTPGGRETAGGGRSRTGGSPPNLLGIALVATAGLVAIVVTLGIFLPAFGEVGRMATRNPATLPTTITVCDRDWRRDPLARTLTAGEIYERTETAPIVVSVGLFPACPPEIGAAGGDPDVMATAVWVQVGDDAYVSYDLVGGP